MGSQAQRIGAELRKAVTTAMRMLVLEIDRQLRLATPVDTGHARRNWIPSVGEANSLEAKDDALRAQGLQQVLSYSLEQGTLWVANVVPYIRRLNYGHSQQAPAGFVERAVDMAMQIVHSKTGKLGDMHASWRDAVGGEAAENLASAYSPFGDA